MLKMSHLFYVLSPTIFISVLVGTSVFVINRTKNEIKLKLAPNAIILVHIKLILYIIVTFHAFLFVDFDQLFQKYDSFLLQILFFFPSVSGIVLIATSYVSGFYSAKDVVGVLDRIVDVDQSLVYRGATFRDLKYRRTYRYQLFYYAIVVLAFLIIMISQVIVVENLSFLDPTSSMKFISYFPIFVDVINEGQYTTIVKLLQYRFQYINKQIKLLNENDAYFIKLQRRSK